jgi:predicted dehydrogenase
MKNRKTRRNFIKKTTVIASGFAFTPELFNSVPLKYPIGTKNDKIKMGFIGIGNRGTQLLHSFMGNEEVLVTALCDIYDPYLSRDYAKVDDRYKKMGMVPKMGETFGNEVKKYSDYRKLLEDKNVDAVCIATPDHWHAIQTIQAIRAGKDVYVEKPLTITLREGRDMVTAQKNSNQVVTVGLNRRGSMIYQKMAGEIQAGKLGKITVANALRISNMTPDGIGSFKPEAPPSDFNWDMWLGPRAYRSYQYNIAPYKFRWWSDYSSQMGNWGVHYMDAIRWMMGETAPAAISAHGGKYVLKHDGDIPDTMEVLFEFASGALIRFGIHEACGGGDIPTGEIELKGTKGNLGISERGYQIIPSGPGQFQSWENQLHEEEYDIRSDQEQARTSLSEDPAARLIRNFLDCVKTREESWCSLEEGHRSTSFAHLANIALKTKKRLEWDPVAERITNDKKANDLLHYEYRDQWKNF